MQRRMLAVGAAVLAATAIVPAAAGAGSSRDRATGGGQAFLDSREPGGAGDTVAFTAQRAKGATGSSDDATGQIQVNRRGTDAVKFHGTVTCLVVNGGNSMGNAYMSGMSRATSTTPAQPFELYVTDGGKGPQERNDMIMLFVGDETDQGNPGQQDDTGPCGFAEQPDTVTFARGNVQTYNANTGEDETASSSNSIGLGQTGVSPTRLLPLLGG